MKKDGSIYFTDTFGGLRLREKDPRKELDFNAVYLWKDGKVTLRTAECLAACGTAPVMQVDKKYYENLTIAEVDRIIDTLVKD